MLRQILKIFATFRKYSLQYKMQLQIASNISTGIFDTC